MDWFKMGTRYMLTNELSKVQKGAIAEGLALVALHHRMPTDKELFSTVSPAMVRDLDETLSRVYSSTFREVLQRCLTDVSKMLQERFDTKERVRKHRENKECNALPKQPCNALEERRGEKRREEENIKTEFDQLFWFLYPRKISKAKALKSFITARKKVDIKTILDGLNKYVSYIKKEGIEDRFIKHPPTWLNQKCWTDEWDKSAQNTEPKRKTMKDVQKMLDEQR